MAGIPTFLNLLRIWIGFVALMAFGNTVQCFVSERYVFERLYTLDGQISSSALAPRLFGTWTLLAAFLRISCAFNIENKMVYNLTLMSFVLALAHFTSEVFIYKSAVLSVGIIAPLIVSSVSIVMMTIGFFYLRKEDKLHRPTDENSEILKGKSRKKIH